MMSRHRYQILLLLGSLLAAPLHAAGYNSKEKSQEKAPSPQVHTNIAHYYSGQRWFELKKDNINEDELRQGLIGLSRRIKAKDGRKVYFFMGGRKQGKASL